MLTISLSLVLFLSVFATLVISRQGYYFNDSGLLACDIFYIRPSFRILSACMFYFPATMLFMYCYGSLYHFSYKKCSLSTLRNFNLKSAKSPLVSMFRTNKQISHSMVNKTGSLKKQAGNFFSQKPKLTQVYSISTCLRRGGGTLGQDC